MMNLANKKKVSVGTPSRHVKSKSDGAPRDFKEKKLPFNLVFEKEENGLHVLKFNDASDVVEPTVAENILEEA